MGWSFNDTLNSGPKKARTNLDDSILFANCSVQSESKENSIRGRSLISKNASNFEEEISVMRGMVTSNEFKKALGSIQHILKQKSEYQYNFNVCSKLNWANLITRAN